MGSGDNLESRLQALAKILDKRVTLTEPPRRSEDDAVPPVDGTETAAQQEGVVLDQLPTQRREAPPQVPQTVPSLVLERQAFDCSNFHVGQPEDENFDFCPWVVVQSYPDFYIGKANRPRAKPFFEKILQGRVWDFFYLHDLRTPEAKPRLLVPTNQFIAFLDSINRVLGTALTIPIGLSVERFHIKFIGGTPRPRYLMRNRDTTTLEIESWPPFLPSDLAAYNSASSIRQHDYEASMNLMSKQSRGDRSKAAELRAAKKKENGLNMLREVQTYLRLNGNEAGFDAVFLCFDAEALERPPHPVSEIGIAILDLQDTHRLDSGPSGRDWWPKIKAHHLRTKEYSGLVNHRYVKGCPGAFDFGTSIFPAKAELSNAVMAILEPYTSASRKLLLVGHDVGADIKYLSEVGVGLLELPNLIGQLDSQMLHQYWRDLPNGRGLSGVLADLCIGSKNLHNAGNDAVFTLQAVISVAIESIRQIRVEEAGEEYTPALWTA